MSKDQLHKRFTTEQVKMLLQWYVAGSLTITQACERLECKRTRFYELLDAYRKDPVSFSISHRRSAPAANRLHQDTDAAIFMELERQKALIQNPHLPIRYYHYRERMVLRCAKAEVKTMQHAQVLLDQLVHIYNEQWVHATTREIPRIRYERALRDGASVLQTFSLPEPYTSLKDIFCLRDTRIIDGYRKVNWRKYEFSVPKEVPVGVSVELHIIPDEEHPEIRVWYRDRVVHVVRLHR